MSVAVPVLDSKLPINVVLKTMIKVLKDKDVNGIFHEPVDTNEVQDYADIIKNPMDFGTMETKIDNSEYSEVAQFLADFRLVMQNCKTYNSPGSVFYKTASNLSKFGEKLIPREAANIIGYVDPQDSEQYETVQLRNYKKTFHRKLCEDITSDRLMPDGSRNVCTVSYLTLATMENSWRFIRYQSLFNQYLNQQRETFKKTGTVLDEKSMNGIIPLILVSYTNCGTFQMISQNTSILKEPISLYYTAADTLGGAYVGSLERFVADLDPELQKHVSNYVNRLSYGARDLSDNTYNYLQNPDVYPKSVKSAWGQLELDKLIKLVNEEVDLVLKAGEILSVRGDVADVGVLVTPILQNSDGQADMAVINAKTVIELQEENKQDIAELETLIQARKLLSEKEVPDEEKVIAERVRQRLVSLIQRAPKSEYITPQQAAPKSAQPQQQMQMNPQMMQQMQQQMQMNPQMIQMLQMQQQSGQPLTPQQQSYMMMVQQQQNFMMQQQMLQMNSGVINMSSNQMMQQQMQTMQMQAMAMAAKQQGQLNTPVRANTSAPLKPTSASSLPPSPAQIQVSTESIPATEEPASGKRKRGK